MQIFSKSLRHLHLLKLSVHSIAFTEIMSDRKITSTSRSKSVTVSVTNDSVESDKESETAEPVKLFSIVRQVRSSHRDISRDLKPGQVSTTVRKRIRIYYDDDDKEEEPQQENSNKSPKNRKQADNETVRGGKAIKSLLRETLKDGKQRLVKTKISKQIRICYNNDDDEEEEPQQENNDKSPKNRKQTDNETVKGAKAIKSLHRETSKDGKRKLIRTKISKQTRICYNNDDEEPQQENNDKSPKNRKQADNETVKGGKAIKSLHREISKDGEPGQVKTKISKQIGIHCNDDEEPQQKNNNKTLRKRKTENATVKAGKAIKKGTDKEVTQDIEDIWQPENWQVVLDNIQKMRKMYKAPVDSLGSEECHEKNVAPEVFRYQTLISVMLSSQTRDEITFAASERLIDHGLTVDNILATPDNVINDLIYPVGFCKSKVRYIKNATQMIKDQFNGDIPRTFVDLCKLPGVGPKIAHLVMSIAWKETVGIAVDTHVHRISNRMGWVPKPTKEPEQTRKALEKWLPKEEWGPINVTLVGFGQTICRPIGPHCAKCLNSDLCPFGKSVLSGKNKKKKQLK